MSKSKSEEITPDELMESFRGRSLKSIIVFTVVVHAFLLLGTSIPFLIKMVTGKDTTELSEEERLELAMKDATASLKEIAEEYGLNPRELSSNFAGSKKGPAQGPAESPKEQSKPPGLGEQPKDPAADSAIEKEIRTKKEGPKLPGVGDEEEDLFK